MQSEVLQRAVEDGDGREEGSDGGANGGRRPGARGREMKGCPGGALWTLPPFVMGVMGATNAHLGQGLRRGDRNLSPPTFGACGRI